MYVLDSAACAETNSETPMSAERIAAADMVMASYASRFVSGNNALNDLVASLYGNPSNITGGDAGVPTGWTTGAPQVPIPMVLPVPGSVASLLDPIANSGDRRRRRYARLTEPGAADNPGVSICRPPQVVPFATSGMPAAAVPGASSPASGGISAGWWIALGALLLAAGSGRSR